MARNLLNVIHVNRILMELSDEAHDLYVAIVELCKAQGSTNSCHAPREVLIKEAGVSVSQYKAAANELESAGLISRNTNWTDPNCRHHNEYTLHFPAQKSKMDLLAEKIKTFQEAVGVIKDELKRMKELRLKRRLKGNGQGPRFAAEISLLTQFSIGRN